MNRFSLRATTGTASVFCALASLCSCVGGLGCGDGYTDHYRDVVRDTAILVAGKTAYVQLDRNVSGEFRSFDSSETALADIVRRQVVGLGDTLRFHAVFREMYYDQPDDSIPVRRYLRISTDPDSATTPVVGFARTWSCGESSGAAAREASSPTSEGKVACSLPAPGHELVRMEIEHDPGRKLVVGF